MTVDRNLEYLQSLLKELCSLPQETEWVCTHEKLVAFSCKRRGFCPSCGGRRMTQTAAHLVDHVVPNVPVRQWVLSLPIPLRFLLAAHPRLITPVLQVIHRAISTFPCTTTSISAAVHNTRRVKFAGSSTAFANHCEAIFARCP